MMGDPGRSSRPLACLAATATGVLFGLAEPGFGLWPLAPVCLVPLLWAMCGRRPAGRAGLGWIAGTVMALVATGKPAMVGATAYFEIPVWQGVAIALLVGQIFSATSFIFFTAVAGDPRRSHAASAALRVGAALVASEWLRSTLLTGLPWALLAHALTPVPLLAQSAALGGALFVSGWLAVANLGAFYLTQQGKRRAGTVLLVSIATGVGAGAFLAPPPAGDAGPQPPGSVASAPETGDARPGALTVVLIQGAVPEGWRGTSAALNDALHRLIDLSRSAGAADLVVWPENAVSFLLPVNERLVEQAIQGMADPPGYLLVGSPWIDPETPGAVRNAAVLFDPDQRLVGRHDKVHLLPFAEYTPWPLNVLGFPGPHGQAGKRPAPLSVDGVLFGPLICYEIAFSELARSLVQDGAEVLLNISNDAWFGDTGAVEQHFAGAVFRAIETRRPLLRATNTGITAAVDSAGRVVSELPRHVPGWLRLRVAPAQGQTPFVRWGGGVGWLALGVSIAGVFRDTIGGLG